MRSDPDFIDRVLYTATLALAGAAVAIGISVILAVTRDKARR